MDFVNFLIKNYLWIVIAFGILVISIIGFLADKYNKNRKEKNNAKEEKKSNETVNIVDIDGNNIVDVNSSIETPLVTEEIVSESDNFNFPEVDSDNMAFDPTPITPASFESGEDSFMMPEVEIENQSVDIAKEKTSIETTEKPISYNMNQELDEPTEVVNEWEKSGLSDINNNIDSEINASNSNNIDNTITDEDFWKL